MSSTDNSTANHVQGVKSITDQAAADGCPNLSTQSSTSTDGKRWPAGTVGKSEVPKPAPANFAALADRMGFEFRFNERNDEHEVFVSENLVRPPMKVGWQKLSDEGLRFLAAVATERSGQTFKLDAVDQGAMTLGDQVKFDPVKERFNNLRGTWNQHPRLRKFLATYCKAEDNDLNEQYSLLFFLGLVMRIYFPGSKFDFCLVLIGIEGTGKSTLGRVIITNDYFTDQLKIGSDPLKIIEQTAGVAIAEFSELGGYQDKEQEQIKAMLSAQTDTARKKFGKKTTRKMRSCIFYGTTNKRQPLKGVDGNRRFGPVEVGEIDLELLRRDIDQLLAEAIHIFFEDLKGNPVEVRLDPQYYAAAKQRQEEHTEGTLWEPKIQANMSIILSHGIRKFNKSGLDEIFVASAEIQKIVHPDGSLRGADGKYLKEAMLALRWREDRHGKERIRGYKKILTAAEIAELDASRPSLPIPSARPAPPIQPLPPPIPPTVQ